MRCVLSTVVIVSALLVATGTTVNAQCDIACPRSIPNSVTPKVGSTYVYSLETKTTLTPRDSQKVTIKADVEVAVQDTCKSYLSLKNVNIEGVPDGADLAAKVSANPLAFGYFDGRVIDACPVKGEEEWALNIKRAVISALQLSYAGAESTEQSEVDFSGRCPTTFTRMESTPDKTVFLKKKDLNRCKDRRVDLRQTPDMALGQFKELIRQFMHPMDSDLSCQVTLNKDKVISAVECEEKHTLIHRQDKPIHVSNVKLTLKETKAAVAGDLAGKDYEKKRVSISYEHSHHHAASEADVVVVLKKLCTEITGKIADIESSTTFDDLVGKLKHLPDDAAASVDEAVKSNTVCPTASKRLRELFLDASAFAASDSSIKTLVKAHNNKELSISRSTAAFTVVALKAAPNSETIKALLPLVNSETSTRPLVLGLSVLTRRYCQKTDDCDKNPTVKEARDAFLARLAQTQDKLEKVSLLKGLENLNTNKEGSENLIKTLEEIINSEAAGIPARVAAVRALPADPAINDQLKAAVLKESNPNEVRMTAFHKLVRNGGLKNVGEFLGTQEHCVKNYILGYVKNLKDAKSPARRALLPDGVQLSEEPKKTFGISKNLAVEYGPLTIEVDIIYPHESNVTSAINVRVTRATDNKIVDVAELELHQEGLEPNVGNILNLISRKIGAAEFSFQAMKHLGDLVKKLRKPDHTHNTLQATVALNGKNVIFSDIFEDLHDLAALVRKRVEKMINEKKVDHSMAGVLIDTKVVVPTISGIPVVYKLDDNFVMQINGEVKGEPGKRNIDLNRSLVGGLKASAKLLLKDNKIGYEYNAKLALAAILNVDIENKPKVFMVRVNLPENQDRHTFLKFQQSLKEVKSGAADQNAIENELAPEPRSENCFSPLILTYCRKESQVKGLLIPNVEYYVTKTDKNLKAIEFEFDHESPAPDSRQYILKAKGIGAAGDTEHFAQLNVAYPKDGKKEVKLTLKSPTNKFETSFSLNLDSTKNLDVKLNLPHLVDIDVKGKFETNKDTQERTADVKVDYKFPDDATVHTLKYKNKWGFNLKRSNKEKVASADYSSEFESSRRPFLNHKTNFVFRYRPLKLHQLTFEFTYGAQNDNRFRFHRVSNIEVKEMKPFTMDSDNEMQLISTSFDINYDLKSKIGLVSSSKPGLPAQLDYSIKGKDLSKRAAAGGNNDIEGELKYRNKGGDKIDQTIDGKLTVRGREMAYNSEMKQTEPGKYEGKITVQTDKDKKVFIVHKEEATKPTKDMHLKTDIDVSYSHKPEKKHYSFDLKRSNNVFTVIGEATRDGTVYLKTDLKIENGKLKLMLTRDYRSYDLDVDNIFKPKQASLVLKVRDRVYNFKMDRQPLKFINLKVEGNDKAYIQKGDAHISLTDPSTLNLLTKANSDIKVFVDLLSSNKKATLKMNVPKYNFVHDGEIQGSLVSRRLQWKAHTKTADFEHKLDADIARKGSLITFTAIHDGQPKTLKYSRNGDKVMLEIDGENDVKIEGDRKSGKITIKGKDGGFTLESNYRVENDKFIIESVSNNNAKLEALISRKEPSKFVFESPKVKTHMNMDLSKPLKTLNYDFDSPIYQSKINAELEWGKKFSYIAKRMLKNSKKEYNFQLVGVPRKELNLFLDYPAFKLKVERPSTGDKVKFTYTFNDYTESEEYAFDQHQPLVASWLHVIRQYLQSFIVE